MFRAGLLGFAAGLSLLASSLRPVSAGWWDDLDKGERVRLSDVVADPGPYEGKTVTFPCVFRAIDDVFFPYFTSFTRDKHVNLSVWLDGAPIWERESYAKAEFPFLYVRRDHPQRDEILRIQPFTRIEVTGKVKDVYRAKPWIEMSAFRVAPATLGREVVEWVKAGDAHAQNGDLALAEAYYKRALAEVTLEETYALRVRQRRADVLRTAGREEEAKAAEGATPLLGGTPIPAATPGATPRPPAAPPPAAPARDTFPEGPLPGRAPATPPVPATPPTVTPRPAITTDDLPGVPYSAPRAAAPNPPASRPVESPPPRGAVPPTPPPAVAAPPAAAPPAAPPAPSPVPASGRAAPPGAPVPPPPPPGPCALPPVPGSKANVPPAPPPPAASPTAKTEVENQAQDPKDVTKKKVEEKVEKKVEKKDTPESPTPPPSPPPPPSRVPRLSGVR